MKDEFQGVAAGQRYRVAGSVALVWEVVSVSCPPGEPLPHVRLVRVGQSSDVKTVSVRALKDRRYYEPVR